LETTTVGKKFSFISESPGSKLVLASMAAEPEVQIEQGRGKSETIQLHEFIDIKGWKALGNKLNYAKISGFKLLTSSEEAMPEDEKEEDQNEKLFKIEIEKAVKEDEKKAVKEKEEPIAKKSNKGKEDKKDKKGQKGYAAGTTITLDFKPKKK
jgi:hypothetical protein